MSKRERRLNQRLEELFSSEPTPKVEGAAPESVQAARAAAEAAALPPRTIDVNVTNLIEQMPVPVYIKDREHNWVAVNATFCQRLGYDASVLLGHVDKEQADEAWQLDDRVLESGEVDEEQQSTTLPDGSIRTVRTRRVPLVDKENQVAGLMGIIHEALMPGEATRVDNDDEIFRVAVESMPNPIVISRVRDDLILFANVAFADLVGVSLEQLIGQPAVNLYANPADREAVAEIVRREGAVRDYEAHMRHSSGRELWVNLNLRPLRFNNEACVITNVTDITARKAAEADLIKFKLGIDRANAAVTITDAQGAILYVNPAYERIYGYSREEVIGQNPRILKSGLVAPEQYQRFWTQLMNGQPVTGEIVNRAKDGRLVTVETNNSPILDESGKIIGFLSMQYDINERKLAEIERERLLKSEAQRALQLQTAAAVSSAVGTILNLDELLPFIVDLIQARFDLYYVGLFLINPEKNQAELRAATGEAGRQLLNQHQHLPLDEHSMIGWSIAQRRARIALDVGEDAIRFSNPLLPETRSEVTFPLISRGQVLGAMTAQSHTVAAFSDQDVTVLQSMVDQVANAIANAQLFDQSRAAQQQAEARVREVQFLQRVSQASSATLDPDRVYDVVFDALQHDMGFTHIALVIFNTRNDQALIVRASGTASGLRGLDRRISDLENDIVMLIARRGQIEVIDGWDERFDREIYERERHDRLVRAFVPLVLRGESIGLLEVGYQRVERARITDDEVRLLGSLADQIAVAVANAQLFEETGRRVTEMSILNEISQVFALSQHSEQLFATIHAQVSRLFDTQNFFIITYEGGDEWTSAYHLEDGARQPPAVYPLGSGFTSHILRTHQAILVHNGAENQAFHNRHGLKLVGRVAKSWMGVPLMVSNRPIGVMGIQNYDHDNVYHDHDLVLFSTIAAQAASAIQNARLFEQTQKNARELAALNELARTISQQTEVVPMLEVIYQNLQGLLSVDAFIVGLYDEPSKMVNYPVIYDEGQRFEQMSSPLDPESGIGRAILSGKISLILVTPEELAQMTSVAHAIGNVDKPSASLLYVPMQAGPQVIGALSVQSYQLNAYTEDHVRLISAVAGQLSIAVQNAQLYEQTRRTAKREQVLREITAHVRGSIDPETIVRAAVQDLGQALNRSTFIRLGNAEQLISPYAAAPVRSDSASTDGTGSAAQGDK